MNEWSSSSGQLGECDVKRFIVEAEEGMKEIIAIVRPFLAEKVLNSLSRVPVEALTVREVKGYGKQKNYLTEYADNEYSMAFLPKVEICLWVEDHRAEEVLRTVVEVGRTGRMGDGKVFVLPVIQPEAELNF